LENYYLENRMPYNSSYPTIPIGGEDYKKLIDNENTYIDKTLLIQEFWQDGAEVILTPRPRRFGKTLNLSMLKYFFEKTSQKTAYLFKNTNIWNIAEYRDLQGKFPVIFLTFKDIKVDSWESAYEEFTNLLTINIEKLLSPAYPSLTPVEQNWYARLVGRSATEADYSDSLLYATVILERHYQKKVIILIDEYDAPIIGAYLHNYYEKMMGFMRSLLSKVLKTNPALEKGFLTGITRTAREGIFSGLNNLSVCTILNTDYSDKFGFTQEEVETLLVSYNLTDKKDDIKRWYDGYVFGQTNIYNPWSLLNCIKNKGNFDTYWANTSNNDLIKDLITQSNQIIKDDIELLLQGKILTNKKVDENVSLRDLRNNSPGFWGMFLSTGYLTAISHTIIDDKYHYTLAIPNKEITLLYKELVAKAIDQTLQSGQTTELFNALMTGNQHKLTILLQEFIANSCSYYDLPKDDPEQSIHMFVLGLLAGLSSRYIIQSNRESGDGRYDIMLKPRKSEDPGILIEFKKAKSDKSKTLRTAANKAVKQIKALNYETQLKTFDYQGPIFCYGIAVYRKHIAIIMEKI